MISASIPRIELGAELGRGAHSVVLRGVRDGRAFAVKLPLDLGTDAKRELAHRRFLREAVALARVHDPSLPAVMEVGRAGGVPYLVMELAVGETLSERLARGPMQEAEVLALGRRLASALDSIHAAGLIHRDVKPDNVVFDAASGVAKLVDMGSASLADASDGPVGTRAYAAPELLSAGARFADARTDLYSLGCVLAACLGQRHSAQESVSFERPFSVGRLVHSGVSTALTQVIDRLLALDPQERYPSATRLLEDLDRLVAPVVPSVPPVRSRLLGRNTEIERMRRAWADAQRAGRIVVLTGEPGTGKTRLSRAFEDDMRSAGTNVLTAACHPRDPRSFSVVRQLVDGHLKESERLPPAERARALAKVRRLAGDLGGLLKLLSPTVARVFHDVPSIPASENAEQAFAEGLAKFLAKLLREMRPVVVVIDDIQWLHASDRRVLSRAVHDLGARTLLVLGARLGESAPAVERFVETLSAPVARVELTPLSDDDAIELGRQYLAASRIDGEVRRTILRLSDGTPLRVLEVLRTLVDEGVLLPHWGEWKLNADAVAQMHLPSQTTSLLRRRIATLDSGTRSILTTAAVIGMKFDDDLLIVAVGADALQIESGLAEGRRAEIVEGAGPRAHRFIHHTIRDALLSDESRLPAIHQRVAEALDVEVSAVTPPIRFEIESDEILGPTQAAGVPISAGGSPDADPIYRLAFHFASGVRGKTSGRMSETNILAGRAAVVRFDNERAIDFFEAADAAFDGIAHALEPQVRLLLAESRLRLGAFDEALTEFGRVLSATSDSLPKTTALVRIAWIHELRLDSTRAWEALEQAFETLGEKLPRESAGYALGSLRGWLLRRGPSLEREARSSDRARDELLCALYYETGRIALNNGKPLRTILAALRSLEPAERLGLSSARAKSYQAYGFVLTLAGLPGVGARYLALAEDIGEKLHDPVVYSHALQMHGVIAAWGGRFQDAIDAGAKCVLEYGHWRELGDYCLVCYNQCELESVRGRNIEAWMWLDLAIQRVNQHEGAPVVPGLLLLSARAALLALGRENDAPRLLRRLELATVHIPKDSGFHPFTFAYRVAVHTLKGELGPEFEALVAEFQALNLGPKRVHIIVLKYYVHVAHARVHSCLRSGPEQRSERISKLSAALSDLKAAAKIPALRAHALAIEGYHHFFEGRRDKAVRAFDEAERLGRAETAPWVLYSVHRGRAHMLRSEGNANAAKDQAVLAESVATEHGSVYQARWVREEFGIHPRHGLDASYMTASLLSEGGSYDDVASIAPGASRARRQLRALLRISQARAAELAPDHQARLVVDELVQALRAERGFLFLARTLAGAASESPGAGRAVDLEFISGRDAAGRDLGEPEDHDGAAVRQAMAATLADEDRSFGRSRVGTTARSSAMSAPLVVDDERVGVVYLDRPLAEGVFSDADGEVLAALAGQVSVALELTRALRAREHAQEHLRNAEKMDAVARLAGGIAHDLNNMLSAIRLATIGMMTMPGADEIVGEDVRTIQSAVQRANELTKQLGTFSHAAFGTPQLVKLGKRVERLLPVIVGLAGDTVKVDVRLGARIAPILIDPNQMDQVLMNLAVNARDAMVGGGTMTIQTSEITPDDDYLREHPGMPKGRYVCLSLSDTGHGMDENVRQKIFEPYFTTKRDRGGTGLGLASVYWIVSQSGGHVDVKSVVGGGTTFTLFFPRAERGTPADRERRSRRPPRATVLLVEEDTAVAREIEGAFTERGYRVVAVRTGGEALDRVRRGGDDEEFDLLITDVVMSGMNGLELAREIRKEKPRLGVLFVSGDTSGVLAARGILEGEVEFLPKPVPVEQLVRRARAVLDRNRRASPPA